ncbi:MAG: YraN family protein [Desulfuromonadales bacterium]|nr:YraN family protein [Desulfuromonadales bacterium]
MTEARLTLGRRGEEAAAAHLVSLGMKIMARNVRTPVGEVDLVARSGRLLVFVEVKTRSSLAFGLPEEAVGPRKQRQIIRAAQWYMNQGHGHGLQPRFDVIAVLIRGAQIECRHIEAAFSL